MQKTKRKRKRSATRGDGGIEWKRQSEATGRGGGGGEGNKRKIVVSGTKPMEPAACRETLHSMAFGPQLGVGERFLGYGGNVCKLYDSTFGAHCSSRGLRDNLHFHNHLRGKVDRGRSVFDGNKRSVRGRRFSTGPFRIVFR